MRRMFNKLKGGGKVYGVTYAIVARAKTLRAIWPITSAYLSHGSDDVWAKEVVLASTKMEVNKRMITITRKQRKVNRVSVGVDVATNAKAVEEDTLRNVSTNERERRYVARRSNGRKKRITGPIILDNPCLTRTASGRLWLRWKINRWLGASGKLSLKGCKITAHCRRAKGKLAGWGMCGRLARNAKETSKELVFARDQD